MRLTVDHALCTQLNQRRTLVQMLVHAVRIDLALKLFVRCLKTWSNTFYRQKCTYLLGRFKAHLPFFSFSLPFRTIPWSLSSWKSGRLVSRWESSSELMRRWSSFWILCSWGATVVDLSTLSFSSSSASGRELRWRSIFPAVRFFSRSFAVDANTPESRRFVPVVKHHKNSQVNY